MFPDAIGFGYWVWHWGCYLSKESLYPLSLQCWVQGWSLADMDNTLLG